MTQQLLELIARQVELEVEVTPASRLREDLGMNSLSMMMILWETEQLTGRKIDLARLNSVSTVEDFLTVALKEEQS